MFTTVHKGKEGAMGELHARTAVSIADDVRAGRLRASDILEHHLDRIDRLNAASGTFVFVDPERARSVAADVDRRVAAGDDPGPLAGVPLGIKELEQVEGWPDTHASTAFAEAIAPLTNIQCTRLLAAGAVPVGLTAAPEMGLLPMTNSILHGPCRNPWNLERNTGGSSGGSAAAVVAGFAALGTGGDMGGSIRLPAGLCGAVGVKGTYGRVPRGPGYLGNVNIVHYGPLARSVRDAARYLDCVVGADERDPWSLPAPPYRFEDEIERIDLAGLRVAFCTDNGISGCEPAVAAMLREAADALVRETGMKEVELSLHFPDTTAGNTALVVDTNPDVETAAKMPEIVLNLQNTPGAAPIVGMLLEILGPPTLESLGRANQVRQMLRDEMVRVFDEVDVLLVPTTPAPAFPADGPMPEVIAGREVGPVAIAAFTHPFNFTGHPAVSVPAGFVDGLPVGLQIVARRHDDALALAAGFALERARPWPALAPDPVVA
jgi:aspartyl-tRNA(Asn)/glutamyl-tRNA(Gln) amidotransferase subunit A